MTTNEAIDFLKKSKWTLAPHALEEAKWNEAVDMAIEALSADAVHKPDYSYEADMVKRLKEAHVQRWIPCSERLPEKEGCYLICTSWDYNNMDVLRWVDGWNCYRSPNGEICRGSEIDGADIIAWMPLPEPYEGGDDE